MYAPSLQDPVTDALVGNEGLLISEHASYPATSAALRGSRDLAPTRWKSCGQEMLQETALRKRLEEDLQAEKQENAELRQQVRQQFKDLEQLENILGKLETQVEGHEVIIQQQSLRIQDQEQTIQQLNLRLQQYLAAILQNSYKTLRF